MAQREGCSVTEGEIAEHHYKLGRILWTMGGGLRDDPGQARAHFEAASREECDSQARAPLCSHHTPTDEGRSCRRGGPRMVILGRERSEARRSRRCKCLMGAVREAAAAAVGVCLGLMHTRPGRAGRGAWGMHWWMGSLSPPCGHAAKTGPGVRVAGALVPRVRAALLQGAQLLPPLPPARPQRHGRRCAPETLARSRLRPRSGLQHAAAPVGAAPRTVMFAQLSLLRCHMARQAAPSGHGVGARGMEADQASQVMEGRL